MAVIIHWMSLCKLNPSSFSLLLQLAMFPIVVFASYINIMVKETLCMILILILQDAILKLGPLPRLLNDISVALRNPQLHMPTNHQPDRPKDRLFSRPSFNRLMSSDFQSLMMRDLNRYDSLMLLTSFYHPVWAWNCVCRSLNRTKNQQA